MNGLEMQEMFAHGAKLNCFNTITVPQTQYMHFFYCMHPQLDPQTHFILFVLLYWPEASIM